MTDGRSVVVTLVLSLVLHGGVALALRGLGVGPSERDALPPLFIHLVDPVGAPSPEASLPRGAIDTGRERERRSPERAGAPEVRPLTKSIPPAAPAPEPRSGSAAIADTTGGPASDTPSPAVGVAASPPLPPAPPAPPPPPRRPAALDAIAIPSSGDAGQTASASAETPGTPPRDADGERGPTPGGAVSAGAPADVAPGRTPAAPRPAQASGGPESPGGAAPSASRIRDGTGAGEGGGEHASPQPAAAGGGLVGAVQSGAAAAGPRTQARETAPGSGSGGSIPPEYEAYVRALRGRIQERLYYPWLAVRGGLRGTIELELRIEADGALADVVVLAAEELRVLRDAAVRAVRDAAPFPFPPGLAARPLTIRLPVVFELK